MLTWPSVMFEQSLSVPDVAKLDTINGSGVFCAKISLLRRIKELNMNLQLLFPHSEINFVKRHNLISRT